VQDIEKPLMALPAPITGTLRDRKRLAAFPIPSVLRVLSYESATIHQALYDAPNRIKGVDNHLNAIARI